MPALRKFLTLLTVAAVAGGVGAAVFERSSGEAEEAPVLVAARTPSDVVELAEVEVSTVERRDLSEEVRLSGSLQPVVTTMLNARVSGTVETLPFRIGDRVEEGEVVAQLDTDALEAAAAAQEASLQAQRAQLDLAEQVLQRNRQLGQSGITSEAALLEAEANVLNLQAQVRGLETQLADAQRQIREATVTAPFDGFIATRSVEPGQTVGVNTELMTIVDLSRIELNAAVPTSRIAEVQPGQVATFRVEGFPNETFEGEITRISPVAEAGSRAVRVFLTIENEDARLRGGMFATGTLKIRDVPDVIALPAAAVREDDAGVYVLKAENGRLKRQAVTTGASWDDKGLVEIERGLSEGDVVVTAPLPDLQPDVEIRIAEL